MWTTDRNSLAVVAVVVVVVGVDDEDEAGEGLEGIHGEDDRIANGFFKDMDMCYRFFLYSSSPVSEDERHS